MILEIGRDIFIIGKLKIISFLKLIHVLIKNDFQSLIIIKNTYLYNFYNIICNLLFAIQLNSYIFNYI